jgi:hypothetical protein
VIAEVAQGTLHNLEAAALIAALVVAALVVLRRR